MRGVQFDGPAERINYVPMLEEINNARSQFINPESNRNFGTLENELAAIIKNNPDVVIDFQVTPVFEGNSQVPIRIETKFRLDGGRWIEERFINVR